MSDNNNAAASASSRSIYSIGGLVLILFIVILINVLANQLNWRLDATSENLYSLSDGTKNILANLKTPTTLKVFYTKDNVNMPMHIKNYASRFLDFLSEYEYHSKGMITVEVHNTEIDSEEEDWARKYGIEPINLPTGDRIYLGLVALAADKEEVIKTVDPSREKQLEYDITRLISSVQIAKSSKIGVISSLPVFGSPPIPSPNVRQAPPWLFITELKKTYDVEEIGFEAETIPKDIDLLLVIHPKEPPEKLQYAIDQYVLRGGNLIVFVDPFSVQDQSQGYMRMSVLKKLLASWGLEMDPMKILVDFDYATKLRNQSNNIEDNPVWISVKSDAFNKDNIATSQLESIIMPLAGALVIDKESPYKFEPLIQSSTNASLMETMKIQMGVDQIRQNFSPTFEKYNLAVRINGKFKTAFPDGKPSKEKSDSIDLSENPTKKENEEEPDHLAEGVKEAQIVVISDADMLYDIYYVSRQNFLGFQIARIFNDNLNFLLNTSEVMTGNDELISIRTRGEFQRPFLKVEELEKNAQTKWLAREKELIKKRDETNRKLRDFEKKKDASQKLILSPEQEEEIKKFKEEKLRINQELKEVRRNLRADIETLGAKLKVINIFLMPFLVSVAGIAYGIYRRKRGRNH